MIYVRSNPEFFRLSLKLHVLILNIRFYNKNILFMCLQFLCIFSLNLRQRIAPFTQRQETKKKICVSYYRGGLVEKSFFRFVGKRILCKLCEVN